MPRGKKDCREDCFHCPYPDCVKSYGRLYTKRKFWENQEALKAQRREALRNKPPAQERRTQTVPKKETPAPAAEARKKWQRLDYGPKPEGMTEEEWRKEKRRRWQRNYAADHKEMYREASRKYYSAHKAEAEAKNKAYREANREKVNAYQNEWRKKNHEKVLKWRREWYRKNREKQIAYQKERWAKKKAAKQDGGTTDA